MSDVEDFLVDVSWQLVEAFRPLKRLSQSEREFNLLLSQFGWPPPSSGDLAAVRSLFDITTDLESIETLVSSTTLDVVGFTQAVTSIVRKIEGFASSPPNLSGVPAPFNSAVFWNSFPLDLLEWLLLTRLQQVQPTIASVLKFIGVIDEQSIAGNPPRLAYTKITLNFDNLLRFLTEPLKRVQDQYKWGSGAFEHLRILKRTEELISRFGKCQLTAPPPGIIDAYYTAGSPAKSNLQALSGTLFQECDPSQFLFYSLSALILPIPPDNVPNAAPDGLMLGFTLDSGVAGTQTIAVGPLTLELKGGFEAQGGVRIDIHPATIIPHFVVSAGNLDAELSLTRTTAEDPMIVLGSAGATRLQLSDFKCAVKVAGAPTDLEVSLVFSLRDLTFVLQMSSADSFLQKAFGSDPQTVQANVSLIWSSKRGIAFDAGATLKVVIPLHLTIAIVDIDTVSVEIVAGTTADPLRLVIGLTGGLDLGPLAVSVQDLGVAAAIHSRQANEAPGNFGNLDLRFGFKPPTGLGISIDAGAVAGGGFILFDESKGEYAGFLDISIAEIIQVKFIAILDTKLPDGSKGYSLLFIIFMELPPIQLGFGFTLNGVGGVAGVNRSMSPDGLQAGLRNHTLDYVIDPPRTVADAPKVISAVSSFFPVAKDRYVFGPILALGWETFIQLTVGVILEVPDPIKLVLLGIIDAGLPEIDEALIKIHIDVLGILDFGNKKFSLDGSMYDSYVLEFPIAGDLALRMSWGNAPNFLFSLGGFNPNFNTTGLDVPQLKRLSISIGDGDNPRIIATSYMALTSNTAQFGANVEAWASAAGFSVHGYLGFDVLFIFSPHFAFEFDFAAGFDISYQGVSLAGITLSGVLSGTNPWHLHGDASFHVLFFNVSKSVDFAWGDPNPPALPQRAVLDDLLPALNDPQNWNGILPDGTRQSATLSASKPDQKTILVHPMGTLSVIEKVVPLDLPITRYNNATPSDGNYFSLGSVQINSSNASRETFQDFFAAGQFLDLSDTDKLSRSSFEPHDAGAKIGSTTVASGANSARTVSYNEYYIDDPVLPLRISPTYVMPGDVFQTLSYQSAGFLSPLKNTGLNKYKVGPSAPAATTKDPAYVVASVDDLSVRSDIVGTGGATYYRARAALNAHLAKNPQDAGNLQILPAHEVAP